MGAVGPQPRHGVGGRGEGLVTERLGGEPLEPDLNLFGGLCLSCVTTGRGTGEARDTVRGQGMKGPVKLR